VNFIHGDYSVSLWMMGTSRGVKLAGTLNLVPNALPSSNNTELESANMLKPK
jgi:hypothetical protein